MRRGSIAVDVELLLVFDGRLDAGDSSSHNTDVATFVVPLSSLLDTARIRLDVLDFARVLTSEAESRRFATNLPIQKTISLNQDWHRMIAPTDRNSMPSTMIQTLFPLIFKYISIVLFGYIFLFSFFSFFRFSESPILKNNLFLLLPETEIINIEFCMNKGQ